MSSRRTTVEFIELARARHGDYYDYSKTVYVKALSAVTIVCPIHGEFSQQANSHLRGSGCLQCGRMKTSQAKRLSQAEFLRRAKEVHGDIYNYDQTLYQGCDEKIAVICPRHGEFHQTGEAFLQGYGCQKCGEESRDIAKRKDLTHFLKQAKAAHGDTYDYSVVEYESAKSPVRIICRKHGEFSQTPCSHYTGSGCPQCVGAKISASKLLTHEAFLSRAREVHGYRYDYTESEFKGYHSMLVIKCPQHGEFEQLAGNHLAGYGCRACGRYRCTSNLLLHDPDYPAFVYAAILALPNGDSPLKLGITVRSVTERLKQLSRDAACNVKMLDSLALPVSDAINLETWLKQHFVSFRYYPAETFSGYTECYMDAPFESLQQLHSLWQGVGK